MDRPRPRPIFIPWTQKQNRPANRPDHRGPVHRICRAIPLDIYLRSSCTADVLGTIRLRDADKTGKERVGAHPHSRYAVERLSRQRGAEDVLRDAGETVLVCEVSRVISFVGRVTHPTFRHSVLLNFICTNVIQTNVQNLHETLRKASSLDDMMQLHESQYVLHLLLTHTL